MPAAHPDVLHGLQKRACARDVRERLAQPLDHGVGGHLALALRLERNEHEARIGLPAAREARDAVDGRIGLDDVHHFRELALHRLERRALVRLNAADDAPRILLREEALRHDDVKIDVELLLLLKKPSSNIITQDQVINLIYTISLNLIYKLEKLVNNINRSIKQKLNTEVLNSNIPNLKPFKVVEESTKKVYNIIFPNYLVYIFNLYYITLEEKGKGQGALEPNLTIISSNIEDIINFFLILLN